MIEIEQLIMADGKNTAVDGLSSPVRPGMARVPGLERGREVDHSAGHPGLGPAHPAVRRSCGPAFRQPARSTECLRAAGVAGGFLRGPLGDRHRGPVHHYSGLARAMVGGPLGVGVTGAWAVGCGWLTRNSAGPSSPSSPCAMAPRTSPSCRHSVTANVVPSCQQRCGHAHPAQRDRGAPTIWAILAVYLGYAVLALAAAALLMKRRHLAPPHRHPSKGDHHHDQQCRH